MIIINMIEQPVPVVDVNKSVICIKEHCENVLIGPDTPKGKFVYHRAKASADYGGDVLVFYRSNGFDFAVHKIPESLKHKRSIAIKEKDPEKRNITNGCVNVSDSLYEKLGSFGKIIIK